MAVTIDKFLQGVGQGSRPNQFVINIDFPGLEFKNGGVDGKNSILCKAASLPASTIGVVEVPFRGRTIKLSGDRTYSTWSTTYIADESLETRSRFEQWNNMMNRHEEPTAIFNTPTGAVRGYAKDIFVMQIQKNSTITGNTTKIYLLKHAFPTNIGSIELAYDNNNTVSEYTIDFEYSYFLSTDIAPIRGTEAAANTADNAGELFGIARDILSGTSGNLNFSALINQINRFS